MNFILNFLDDKTLNVLIRGRGLFQIVVLVINDFYAKFVLQNFTNSLCKSKYFSNIFKNQARIHFILNYDLSIHLAYIKSLNPDIILIFGTGLPKTVIFSPNTLNPHLFDASAFDETVKKLLIFI